MGGWVGGWMDGWMERQRESDRRMVQFIYICSGLLDNLLERGRRNLLCFVLFADSLHACLFGGTFVFSIHAGFDRLSEVMEIHICLVSARHSDENHLITITVAQLTEGQ